MRTVLLLLGLFFLNLRGFSQTKSDVIFKKIKNFVMTNSAAPKESRSVYYNRADKIFEMSGVLIPISDVKFSYKYDDKTWKFASHYVLALCKDPDEQCITYSTPTGHKSGGLGISFKTKQNCYEFMNLISELRDAN